MRLRNWLRKWLGIDDLVTLYGFSREDVRQEVKHQLDKHFFKTETMLNNHEHVIKQGGEDLMRVQFDLTLAISDAVSQLMLLKQELMREENEHGDRY